MAKYTLNVWGWEIHALGHPLCYEQIEIVHDIMEVNGYHELWEAMTNGEIEEDVIDDISYG